MKLRSAGYVFLLALLVGLSAVWHWRTGILLWLENYNYTPPAQVAQLADQAALTSYARQIFYAARPTVDTSRQSFEAHCQTPLNGKVVELGCYSADRKIYILSLSDPKLSGEMVVVAAHEMLHAAYDRLDPGAKDQVDSDVEQALSSLNDTNLSSQVEIYQRSEPGQLDNELHSLLGTEETSLPSGLETYYQQYFTSRDQVVASDRAFTRVFDEAQANLDNLHAQINTLRQQMNVDLSRKQITAYNALVPRINSLIDQYNQAVDYYNQLSRSLQGTESTSAPAQ